MSYKALLKGLELGTVKFTEREKIKHPDIIFDGHRLTNETPFEAQRYEMSYDKLSETFTFIRIGNEEIVRISAEKVYNSGFFNFNVLPTFFEK
jgi:hypothetical protein